jgi:archaetidylinositol phosphate synthase
MSPSVAMGFLIAYFLMNIEIYLATYTLGIFKLSYGVMGPTELRVIVCIGNLVLLSKKSVRIGDGYYLLCDVSGIVAIVVLVGIAIVSSIKNTKRLYNEERLP